MEHNIVPIILSLVLGVIGAFMVSRFGCLFGLVDRPNVRSSHSRAIPKGGGIGILAAFVLVSVWTGFPILIWLPSVALAIVSLAGDRIEISPKLRLVMQFGAAGAVCWQVAAIFPGMTRWRIVGLPLGLLFAVVFIVAIANVYNFMDGINGIAGITGIVAFALLAITGFLRGESPAWVLVSAALATACAGFLPWNFPKARVFMGDVGSILIGFIFAVFVVAWSRTLADFIMFCAFLFPFYADELVTLIPRLRSGNSLTLPHRRHVYQILVNQMGMPHWKVSSLYGLIQVGVAGGAIWIHPRGWISETGWLALVFGVGWCLASWVRRREI